MRKVSVLVLFCLVFISLFAVSVSTPGGRATVMDPDAYEPDNSATQYTNLSISFYQQHQLHSLHSNTDQDWFRFYGETGKTYHFHSTGTTDVRFFLYYDNGSVELGNNDDGGEGTNFLFVGSVPANGFYKVKIDGFGGAMGGYDFYYWWEWPPDSYEPDNSPSQCNLLITNSSLQSQSHSIHSNTDQDWYKFIGEQGKTYTFYSNGNLDTIGALYAEDGSTQIMIDDDGAGYPNFRIQFSPAVSAYFYLKVVGSNDNVGDYQLHYYHWASADSYEPDDVPSDPTIISVSTIPQAQDHSLHSSTDNDWFVFFGETGKVYHFISTGGTDTQIFLTSGDGVVPIANNDDGNGYPNFYLVFSPTFNSYYALKIIGYGGDVGEYDFHYFHTNTLPMPQNVNITRSGTAVNITWNAVPGAVSYLVEVSDNPNSGFQAIGATTAPQWSVISSEPRIFFRIRASSAPVP